MSKNADDLAQLIRDKAGSEPVQLGLVLGSGLGPLADAVAVMPCACRLKC